MHELVTLPSDTLRAPTKKVGAFNDALLQLIQDMRVTMHEAKGVGLAAPQIGLSHKLAVIEFDPTRFDEEESDDRIPFFAIINPTVTSIGGEVEIMDEGCLSVPDLTMPVPRATEITVLGQNERGERIRIRARDFLARILQHEIDHLNGYLIVDRTTNKKIRKQFSNNV